ncbi:MAG: hypothetical protein AB1634_09740 [Thermodesulfobacteriota bacterium]
MTEEKTVLEYEANVISRLLAFVSYLGILCFFPLVLSQRDDYVHFHARQGLVIWILEVIAIALVYVPGAGFHLLQGLGLLCLVYSVAGLVSVLLGRAWRLPIVGQLATKL